MGTRRLNVRVTWLGRFVRGRGPDHNPLRRTSDRGETAVLAVLLRRQLRLVNAASLPLVAAPGSAHGDG